MLKFLSFSLLPLLLIFSTSTSFADDTPIKPAFQNLTHLDRAVQALWLVESSQDISQRELDIVFWRLRRELQADVLENIKNIELLFQIAFSKSNSEDNYSEILQLEKKMRQTLQSYELFNEIWAYQLEYSLRMAQKFTTHSQRLETISAVNKNATLYLREIIQRYQDQITLKIRPARYEITQLKQRKEFGLRDLNMFVPDPISEAGIVFPKERSTKIAHATPQRVDLSELSIIVLSSPEDQLIHNVSRGCGGLFL